MSALHRQVTQHEASAELDINPVYFREKSCEIPRHRLPEHGVLARTALQVVRDELILDGNARLNLATFVTTWMEPQAQQLMTECLDKNMIDKDEYPQTAMLEERCVNILADLWHAPECVDATGCSTTGSSEACMLAGMALLWRWRERRRAAGAAADRPNLVMGANVQVCWEKFCRYWQVEPRLVPMAKGRYHLTGPEAAARCDENTVGVVAVLGSTMDGSYEPVSEINDELDKLAAGGGPDVPMHVDGASGGFVAPFLQPDLAWDFRVPQVASINARDGPVRADQRGARTSGVRIQDRGPAGHVHGVRPVRAAAHPRLAGARLHLPRGSHRRGGHPGGDPQRLHPGPGRPVPGRPGPPPARAGGTPAQLPAARPRRQAPRLRPLMGKQAACTRARSALGPLLQTRRM